MVRDATKDQTKKIMTVGKKRT